MMDLLTSLYGFGVCLEIIALIMTVWFLHNSVNRFRRHPQSNERKRSKKFVRDLLSFLSAWIFFFAGLAVINFALFLQAYRTYAIGEPIAQVEVVSHSGEQEFSVHIQELNSPLSDQEAPVDETFRIQGDRWLLEGHIIRFRPWLSFLGLKPVYQLTRIQGSYFSIEEERTKERTVYPLVDPSSEQWWKWMYAQADRIPLFDLAYGSAVSQDAKEGSRYIVTVLPSGFSLQKADE